MNIIIKFSPEFANTISSSIISRSEIASTISNAKEIYLYCKRMNCNDSEIKSYLFSKLTRELNNLKSVEFKIDSYPKKELFYKTKHQIEELLNKLV